MSKQVNGFKGPVVIGGVGGSGTRVVAEIINNLGFYMGQVNKSNDNKDFARLFGSPEWYKKNANKKKALLKRLKMFEKRMLHSFANHQPSYMGWGWKNPITHIYMESLAKNFKNMKYIFVIRHGLEMVYSKNQNQLHKWGHLYHIKNVKRLPKASLYYWFSANEKAIRQGEKLFGRNFLTVNYNQLCLNPKKEIKRMLEFLEMDLTRINMDKLVKLIHPPESLERYKDYDLSIFTESDFDLVRKLGFEI